MKLSVLACFAGIEGPCPQCGQNNTAPSTLLPDWRGKRASQGASTPHVILPNPPMLSRKVRESIFKHCLQSPVIRVSLVVLTLAVPLLRMTAPPTPLKLVALPYKSYGLPSESAKMAVAAHDPLHQLVEEWRQSIDQANPRIYDVSDFVAAEAAVREASTHDPDKLKEIYKAELANHMANR